MGVGDLSSGLANWILGESALGWCLGTALSCCVILGLFLTLSGPQCPSVYTSDSMILFGSEMGPTSLPAPRIIEEENAPLEWF